jgi:hypothetical protein
METTKRLSAVLLALALLAPAVFAQTNTVPKTNPPPTGIWADITGAFSGIGSASNWIVAPYGIYDTKTKTAGGGLAGVYNVTPYFASVIRMDYINKEIWRPSGSIELQVPVKFSGFTVTPFVFTGLAVPLGGTGADNGSATLITGTGAAVTLKKNKLYAIGDYEWWNDHGQIRAGLGYKF